VGAAKDPIRAHVMELLRELEGVTHTDDVPARRALRELLWAELAGPVDGLETDAQAVTRPSSRAGWAYFVARSERDAKLAWVEAVRLLPGLWRRLASLRSAQADGVVRELGARVAACGLAGLPAAGRKAWLGRLGVEGARRSVEIAAGEGVRETQEQAVVAWCRACVDAACAGGLGDDATLRVGMRAMGVLARELSASQRQCFHDVARSSGLLATPENTARVQPGAGSMMDASPSMRGLLVSWLHGGLDASGAWRG
jgi:hypothetical protein